MKLAVAVLCVLGLAAASPVAAQRGPVWAELGVVLRDGRVLTLGNALGDTGLPVFTLTKTALTVNGSPPIPRSQVRFICNGDCPAELPAPVKVDTLYYCEADCSRLKARATGHATMTDPDIVFSLGGAEQARGWSVLQLARPRKR